MSSRWRRASWFAFTRRSSRDFSFLLDSLFFFLNSGMVIAHDGLEITESNVR
jgi:hypothetical protein